MSTEQKKKSKYTRGYLRMERIRIIEFACIGLVILLFLGLAIWYGTKPRDEAPEAEPTPAPTEDTAIRGRYVFDALENAGFALTPNADGYDVLSPNGTALSLRIVSDDKGILTLSVQGDLCADPEDDSAISTALRELNAQTLDALRALFDAVLPVFHRTAKDSDTIVTTCRKAADGQTPGYAKLGDYTLSVVPDAEAVPATVLVTLSRNP